MNPNNLNSIDLFAGCGGLTEGMKQAGFKVCAGIEINNDASECYRLNHPEVTLIQDDIRKVSLDEIKSILNNNQIHLLAGCPPCQSFSSIRRLNRKIFIKDKRNSLIFEYFRFVKELKPFTIMLENVPVLKEYKPFQELLYEFCKLGYRLDLDVVDIQYYGVPQRRKRLILVGSRLGAIKIAGKVAFKNTVRDAIGNLESIKKTNDPLHKIVAGHSPRIMKLIKMIPLDGGGRINLSKNYQLRCHTKENVGFTDIYGRLSWDEVSSTITGGCLNPSKGRFLHPSENRCITAREAALLQTFPRDYQFPLNISKTSLALLIGNALPPEFSRIQSLNIIKHLKEHNLA
jgi:DNA (cytosine-5)-methyltransferase 1